MSTPYHSPVVHGVYAGTTERLCRTPGVIQHTTEEVEAITCRHCQGIARMLLTMQRLLVEGTACHTARG
jgi:hypothetical protein